MANIVSVDYEAMPVQANQMRTLGQALNDQITNAYQSITNMHTSWYGRRYNDLVREFNNMIPQINELLDLVVGDIPFTLETIANNYSQADQGINVTNASRTAPNRIAEIGITEDVGMKFITGEVETVKTKVSNNFNVAVEKMNSIETIYGRVQWKSEASEAFEGKFRKLKNDIINAFENIDTQFTSLMEQTVSDIQSTENANTVQ